MHSVISVWPLPCTPATTRISPRATSKLTSSTWVTPVASTTVRPWTENVVSPGCAGALSTPRSTVRPTMSEASSVSVELGWASPTTLPRRMTVIRSATARTSRSLWVMNTIEVPDALSWRMISISSSVSCGVSTAVGSSRMRTSASRDSALMISTRCCAPTERSSTSASGSMWNPNRSEISRTCARARCRSMIPPGPVGSCPSTTFSATVNTGTSMKCWWTMPMPAAIASPGPWKVTGVPSTRISPPSGS